MKQRHIPELERLEARETPDVSLGLAAVAPAPLGPSPIAMRNAPPPAPVAFAETEFAARLPQDSTSLQALERFFASPGDLGPLLTGTSSLLAGAASSPAETSADRTHGTFRTPDAVAAGWQYLTNYTRKALRNEERRHGSLPDHDDVVHQVFLDWWQRVGPQRESFGRLLQEESPERFALRKTVRRVLDHLRYEANRDRRRVALFDRPAPVNTAEQDWRDLRLDWALDGGPDVRTQRLLDMRRQGKTFQEMGDDLGLPKQRVCELYNATVEHLRERYRQ